jgi:hypothetical protein
MAKFQKFDSREHIRGLAEAARKSVAEKLIRENRMPSLSEVIVAVEETKKKYRPRILAARKKNSAESIQ